MSKYTYEIRRTVEIEEVILVDILSDTPEAATEIAHEIGENYPKTSIRTDRLYMSKQKYSKIDIDQVALVEVEQ